MRDVSAIVVNYLSADECGRAIESLRLCFKREAIDGEVILVDCGSGREEVDRLRSFGAERLLLLEDNRGYSGGINAGMAAASAPLLIWCNADVEFLPGALTPLLAEAGRSEVGAAAPVQFADREARIYLPTGFGASFWRDLAQAFPSALPARRIFERWASYQWRLWRRGGEAEHLSGSILALRREVVDRIGGLDEAFRFEYEETDWERRLRRAGLSLRAVASARALHFHGTSSSRSAGAAGRAAEARGLFRRRYYGAAGAAILACSEQRHRRHGRLPVFADAVVAAGTADDVVAVSPNRSMRPFLGARLAESLQTSKLREALRGGGFLRFHRLSDGRAGELYELRP